ncbi:hypothetical protein ACFQZE_06655 [Paenibacillus sp. GCM10027627]|uniref:hypothetical protein n=1 Tax=unclassified Paenibacillus TaxID=185978 RepID=UPI0036301CF7
MQKVDFDKMNNKELVEAFEVVLESIEHLQWGFDYVDDERYESLLERISSYKRRIIGKYFDIDGYITVKRLHNLFLEDEGMRIEMWRVLFKNLDRFEKGLLLEDNEQYYLSTLPYLQRDKYDWDKFMCSLVENNQLSQLRMIQSNWNEYGTQVYGCSTSNNGRVCPCLRQAHDTTAHRCFKHYLETNKKSPDDTVPAKLLIANRL